MRFDFTGSSSFDFYQAFEDYEYLSGKTVTLSFWYRTNVSDVVIRQYATTTHDTLTDSSGSWTYHTITFTFGTLQSNPRSANGATIGFWDNSTGNIVSGSYFEITQVQLEVGSEATPFEHRSYGDELARCQRYFQSIQTTTHQVMRGGTTTGYSTADLQSTFFFNNTFRGSPTLKNADGGATITMSGYGTNYAFVASYEVLPLANGANGFRWLYRGSDNSGVSLPTSVAFLIIQDNMYAESEL